MDTKSNEAKKLQQMLESLIEKERRNAKESFKIEHWEMTEWAAHCRAYNRQERCRHLKGSRHNRGKHRSDYAISFHTFIDGSQRIKCLLGCGWEVWNLPTHQYKWAIGLRMVNTSTNTKTASEQPMIRVGFRNGQMEYYRTREEVLAKYPMWDGVFYDNQQKHELDPNSPIVVTYSDDIGDLNPIKGIQPATKMNPAEIIVAFKDKS